LADQVEENGVGRECGKHGRGEKSVKIVLVGKPEGKTALGIPRRRWENGIRMDLGEISLGSGVDSVGSG
jgi:hypothetical protein